MNAPHDLKAAATVGKALAHDSARRHVQGNAPYVDDMPEPAGTLHLAPGLSPRAAGRIVKLDLDAVRAAPGVVRCSRPPTFRAATTAARRIGDDPVLAEGEVVFHGQVIFAVAAETRDQARRAARLAKIEIEACEPAGRRSMRALSATARCCRLTSSCARRPSRSDGRWRRHHAAGTMRIGGQEHFYLEGQASLALPGEDGGVAGPLLDPAPERGPAHGRQVLGVPEARVECVCRRMGGGFGGKETQAAQWAALCAAHRAPHRPPGQDAPRPRRRHDRHRQAPRFSRRLPLGFDDDGRIEAVDVDFAARCGCSADLSLGRHRPRHVPRRQRLFLSRRAHPFQAVRTNTVSNTAFRGFGGPQGMLVAERMMDEIAYATRARPARCQEGAISMADGRDVTPYGMQPSPTTSSPRWSTSSRASQRLPRPPRGDRGLQRQGRHAAQGPGADAGQVRHLLHPAAPQPGRRAGARLYRRLGPSQSRRHRDGAGALHQGGPGGRRRVFGVDLDRIQITATTTGKVPNTSATAASSGSDLNGMAARAAAETIKRPHGDVRGREAGRRRQRGALRGRRGEGRRPVHELCATWHTRPILDRVQLSATGFYATPEIDWDARQGRRPAVLLFRLWRGCARKSPSTPSPARCASTASTSCTTSGAPSIRPSTSARSRAASCRAWAGSPPRSWCWMPKGALRPMRPPPTRSPPPPTCRADFRVRLHREHRQPQAHHLPLQGGGRAALDAGPVGVFGHHRRVGEPQARPLPAPPCPRDPRGDHERGRRHDGQGGGVIRCWSGAP